MGVKLYISGISGNKDVKKRQQRVMMILESKHIPYQLIDITEPGIEDEKDFMHQNAKVLDGVKYALPPQIFMDSIYCGDYEQFDLANENDELEKFLMLSDEEVERIKARSTPRASPAKEAAAFSNGVASKEASVEKDVELKQNLVKESYVALLAEERGAGGDGEEKELETTDEPREETAEEPEERATSPDVNDRDVEEPTREDDDEDPEEEEDE